MGVFVAHLGVFMIWDKFQPKPKLNTPKPNFLVKSQTVVDRETGEKTIYREITISTKIATPVPTPPQNPAVAELPAGTPSIFPK